MDRSSSNVNSQQLAVTAEVLHLPRSRSRQTTVTRLHRHQPHHQLQQPLPADRQLPVGDIASSGSVVSRKGSDSGSGSFDLTLNMSSRTRAAVNDYREMPTSPVPVSREIVLADLHRSVPAASPVQRCDVMVHVDPTRTRQPVSVIASSTSPPLPTKAASSRNANRFPSRQQKQLTQRTTTAVAAPSEPTNSPSLPDDGGITCPQCGRCRCAKCNSQADRESEQSCCCVETTQCLRVVDVVTCVSCVDRLCCHLTNGCQLSVGGENDDENANSGDEVPCECGGNSCRVGCCCRWTLMVALSACLPCLCLYWPLRCVVGGCSRFQSFCRNECCRGPGCRCPRPNYLASSQQKPTIHQPLLSPMKSSSSSSAKCTSGCAVLGDPKSPSSAGSCAAIADQLSRKLDPNS